MSIAQSPLQQLLTSLMHSTSSVSRYTKEVMLETPKRKLTTVGETPCLQKAGRLGGLGCRSGKGGGEEEGDDGDGETHGERWLSG